MRPSRADGRGVSGSQAPPLPPAQMVALLSPMPPVMPATKRPLIKLDTNAPAETKVETASSEPHRPRSTTTGLTGAPETAEIPKAAQNATPAATQNSQTANVQPSEMSPIGQLTSANDNSNTADRHAISDVIDSTENGLNAIKRPLSSDEQKTATLIRTYITRARDALKADDLDGARNLSQQGAPVAGRTDEAVAVLRLSKFGCAGFRCFISRPI